MRQITTTALLLLCFSCAIGEPPIKLIGKDGCTWTVVRNENLLPQVYHANAALSDAPRSMPQHAIQENVDWTLPVQEQHPQPAGNYPTASSNNYNVIPKDDYYDDNLDEEDVLYNPAEGEFEVFGLRKQKVTPELPNDKEGSTVNPEAEYDHDTLPSQTNIITYDDIKEDDKESSAVVDNLEPLDYDNAEEKDNSSTKEDDEYDEINENVGEVNRKESRADHDYKHLRYAEAFPVREQSPRYRAEMRDMDYPSFLDQEEMHHTIDRRPTIKKSTKRPKVRMHVPKEITTTNNERYDIRPVREEHDFKDVSTVMFVENDRPSPLDNERVRGMIQNFQDRVDSLSDRRPQVFPSLGAESRPVQRKHRFRNKDELKGGSWNTNFNDMRRATNFDNYHDEIRYKNAAPNNGRPQYVQQEGQYSNAPSVALRHERHRMAEKRASPVNTVNENQNAYPLTHKGIVDDVPTIIYGKQNDIFGKQPQNSNNQADMHNEYKQSDTVQILHINRGQQSTRDRIFNNGNPTSAADNPVLHRPNRNGNIGNNVNINSNRLHGDKYSLNHTVERPRKISHGNAEQREAQMLQHAQKNTRIPTNYQVREQLVQSNADHANPTLNSEFPMQQFGKKREDKGLRSNTNTFRINPEHRMQTDAFPKERESQKNQQSTPDTYPGRDENIGPAYQKEFQDILRKELEEPGVDFGSSILSHNPFRREMLGDKLNEPSFANKNIDRQFEVYRHNIPEINSMFGNPLKPDDQEIVAVPAENPMDSGFGVRTAARERYMNINTEPVEVVNGPIERSDNYDRYVDETKAQNVAQRRNYNKNHETVEDNDDGMNMEEIEAAKNVFESEGEIFGSRIHKSTTPRQEEVILMSPERPAWDSFDNSITENRRYGPGDDLFVSGEEMKPRPFRLSADESDVAFGSMLQRGWRIIPAPANALRKGSVEDMNSEGSDDLEIVGSAPNFHDSEPLQFGGSKQAEVTRKPNDIFIDHTDNGREEPTVHSPERVRNLPHPSFLKSTNFPNAGANRRPMKSPTEIHVVVGGPSTLLVQVPRSHPKAVNRF